MLPGGIFAPNIAIGAGIGRFLHRTTVQYIAAALHVADSSERRARAVPEAGEGALPMLDPRQSESTAHVADPDGDRAGPAGGLRSLWLTHHMLGTAAGVSRLLLAIRVAAPALICVSAGRGLCVCAVVPLRLCACSLR